MYYDDGDNDPNLPFCLGFIKSLKNLKIEGNPLDINLRNKPTQELKRVLRERQRERENKNFFLKKISEEKNEENMKENRIKTRDKNGLQNINLRNKEINFLTEEILNYGVVDNLDLSKNQIQMLPYFFSKLDPLSVNLNENKIKNINGLEFCEMTRLKNLGLSKNQIEGFMLDLTYENREKILNGIFKNLEILDLSFNRISKLPVIYYKMPNLKYLNLSYNKLKNFRILGDEDIHFNRLEELDLSNNKLELIDQSILRLHRTLNKLRLKNNNIKNFPGFIGLLQLVEFQFEGNPSRFVKRMYDRPLKKIMVYLRKKMTQEEIDFVSDNYFLVEPIEGEIPKKNKNKINVELMKNLKDSIDLERPKIKSKVEDKKEEDVLKNMLIKFIQDNESSSSSSSEESEISSKIQGKKKVRKTAHFQYQKENNHQKRHHQGHPLDLSDFMASERPPRNRPNAYNPLKYLKELPNKDSDEEYDEVEIFEEPRIPRENFHRESNEIFGYISSKSFFEPKRPEKNNEYVRNLHRIDRIIDELQKNLDDDFQLKRHEKREILYKIGGLKRERKEVMKTLSLLNNYFKLKN